ncbi:DUF707 domain-containing protein [Luteolibacter soli]|uniref:DUF707 domain-containing protein n=1 Tax=Luteolibacter soli TaxID=3135280 RepID=A0ABU9B4S5_9BACT
MSVAIHNMNGTKEQLEEFLISGEEYRWFIDPEVHLDGNWEDFRGAFIRCDADLLATVVRAGPEDPTWNWWPSLKQRGQPVAVTEGVAALLPLMRLSSRAAEAILAGIANGWEGHPEALIPTLVSLAELKIEDIGGLGSFTPEERQRRWYGERTWHWRGPVEHVPGMLHFPVPTAQRDLAPVRLTPATVPPRMLYVSPVGAPASSLLPITLDVFRNAGADCLLLQYDEAELGIPEDVRAIRDRDYKWPLAYRNLHPDVVADYDYVFFWDDDLGIKGFDPARFVRIMQINHLAMAQPAIESPHCLSHAITSRKPCPPWRGSEGTAPRRIVGRLTNFVEIMAPVFTRDAWRTVYSYVDPGSHSGWGYDYIPVGAKGIVDALPVVHTRAVQSFNSKSQGEFECFLYSQGLFAHPHTEYGWLFE